MSHKFFSQLLLCAAVSAVVTASVQAAQLEEVVVTARKKVESIQDVPLAVTAITGSDIEQAFTLDTSSLQAFAPNVVFDTIEMGTPGGGGFSIRGVSYQDVDKGFDPTVLVSVDDVPLSTGTGQVFDMIDIERIEILRGPQGTLFGKNVVGGLISIHRVKPQLEETSGKVRLRAGEYKKTSGDVLFNYGEDDWAVKITAGASRQGEGFVDNLAGGDTWDRDTERFGGHILWQPNDTFTAEAIIDYSNLEGTPGGLFNTDIDESDVFCAISGQCSRDPGEPSTGDRSTVANDAEQWNELEKWQYTLRMTANITDDHTLTYVGSLLTSDDDQRLDGDGTLLPIYHFRRWGDFDQFSHELRLSRDTGSNFTWQVGVFHAAAEGTNNQITDPNSYEFGRTTSDSYSVFGEADLAFMDDDLVFTAGMRHINETKKLARTTYLTDDPDNALLGPNAGGSRTDSKNIYRLGTRYHFNDDIMAYASVSTGFRSGGLSPRAIDPEVLEKGYAPEEITSYEVGIRSTFLDGRLNLNVTAFSMDYEDMQIELAIPANLPPGTQLEIANAGEANIQGYEIDFQWLVTDWWRLQGNVGVLDTEYEDLSVNLYGDGLPVNDETSKDLRRAPELSWGLTSTMDWEMGDGNLAWRLSYSWTDSYEATITNYAGSAIEETGILNSSVTYDLNAWQFSVYGRNLTDEDSWTHSYVVNAVRPTADNASPGSLWRFAQRRPPREIGAELLYKF